MKGTGRIYQRGGRWWIQYGCRGEDRRESSKSTRRKDAVALLRRRLEEMSSGRLVGPDAEKVTLTDLKSMVLTDYDVNGRRSRDRVEDAWLHLDAMFGPETRALDVTADRLTRYVVDRQAEGAALATINQELAALRRGFSLAVRAGRLSHRPPFPTLRIQNARAGFFEAGDLAALLPQLPEYLRPVVTFAYHTGWRVQSEVLPLRWAQVDFHAGTVRLEPGTTKNREARVFPFASFPALKALLDDQRARTSALVGATREPIPWVFHRHGERIKNFRWTWAKACKAAGLEGKLVHDLRRSAVRNLERAGVSRSVAMQLTGHKTESVYRRYAIVAEADLREGVAKLAELGNRTVTVQSEGS
jgi:integrase